MIIKTGFELYPFLGDILDFMKKVFNWLMNFYPFDDIDIPLFYFLVGAVLISLTFTFFPGHTHANSSVEDENTVDEFGSHSPFGIDDDYDDDDF